MLQATDTILSIATSPCIFYEVVRGRISRCCRVVSIRVHACVHAYTRYLLWGSEWRGEIYFDAGDAGGAAC